MGQAAAKRGGLVSRPRLRVRAAIPLVNQLAVAPADGSDPGRAIGPTVPQTDDSRIGYDFAPDGSAIIAAYTKDGLIRILPLDGSPGSTFVAPGLDVPSWQRRAP